MTKRALRAGLIGGLFLVLVGFAAEPESLPARLVLQPGSRLTIEGTSNLHDWSCGTSTFTYDIRLQLPEGVGVVPVSVEQVSIDIPITSLACKNDKMNENLAKALRARAHPTIAFRAAAPVRLGPPDTSGRVAATFHGELTVAGVTKTVDIPVQAVAAPNGSLHITGRKAFLMTQFGIEPPTAMLGMLKTANRVTVRFDLIASTHQPL